ncbi:MAG: hypothetical protein ACRCX8_05225 [Sarcina sp.]
MSLKKSGGVDRARAMLLASVIATNITVPAASIMEYNKQIDKEHELSIKEDKVKYDKHRKNRKIEEERFKEIAQEKYEEVKYEQEEIERMKDYTYRTTKELRAKTGLDVVGFVERDITITFYGDTYEQNGGYPGITCTGAALQSGMIASNVYPLGTKIMWEGRVYTVSDRGGSHFNSPNRLDVFLPRLSGENDSDYIKRIYKNGKRTVRATIIQTR